MRRKPIRARKVGFEGANRVERARLCSAPPSRSSRDMFPHLLCRARASVCCDTWVPLSTPAFTALRRRENSSLSTARTTTRAAQTSFISGLTSVHVMEAHTRAHTRASTHTHAHTHAQAFANSRVCFPPSTCMSFMRSPVRTPCVSPLRKSFAAGAQPQASCGKRF